MKQDTGGIWSRSIGLLVYWSKHKISVRELPYPRPLCRERLCNSPLEKGVRGLFLMGFFNTFHVNYNPLTLFSKGESSISIRCANS
jgi:hypothetical protein